MERNTSITPEKKISAVESYLLGSKSTKVLSKELNVGTSTVGEWVRKYKAWGPSGLFPLSNPSRYTKEIKIKAVKEFIAEKGSLETITLKYGIRSKTQLRNWIFKYNNHKEIKSSNFGGNQIMIKNRVTTIDERIEIVENCIQNNRNYNATAHKYNVSYQQVRSWVIKFEESGIDGLLDRRGRKKPVEELTDVEKLKAEMKLLEAKNKRLEMENELLKKLNELEGWD